MKVAFLCVALGFGTATRAKSFAARRAANKTVGALNTDTTSLSTNLLVLFNYLIVEVLVVRMEIGPQIVAPPAHLPRSSDPQADEIRRPAAMQP